MFLSIAGELVQKIKGDHSAESWGIELLFGVGCVAGNSREADQCLPGHQQSKPSDAAALPTRCSAMYPLHSFVDAVRVQGLALGRLPDKTQRPCYYISCDMCPASLPAGDSWCLVVFGSHNADSAGALHIISELCVQPNLIPSVLLAPVDLCSSGSHCRMALGGWCLVARPHHFNHGTHAQRSCAQCHSGC